MSRANHSIDKRLSSINDTMARLNDCVSEIYESLVDEEYDDVKAHVRTLQLELRMLLDSVKNEAER